MSEKLIEEENPIIEKFEVQSDENTSKFKTNKCPFDLKRNNYDKLKYNFGGSSEDSKKYVSSKINRIFDFKAYFIIIMIFYSFVFYFVLITFIIYHDIKLLIFSIILYIITSLLQIIVIPKPIKYKSKDEFDKDINQILNSYVIFKVQNGSKRKKAMYQAKYTVDITGKINIPKCYNFAKINEVQLFAKDDLNKFIKNFKEVYKSSNVDYKMIYNEEDVNFDSSQIYSLNQDISYSINKYTTIFSVFLLQWIYAIYYDISSSKKCIHIYLAKLITNSLTHSPTKFIIHGKRYQVESYVVNKIKDNVEFDKDFQEYQKEIKEKREREQQEREDLERNTIQLSHFKNGRNYTIKLKSVYDTVHLRFDAYTNKRHYWYYSELGSYDPKIKERIIHKDKMTIYYPEGFDIRIEVIRGLNSYTVTIGDEYTENFSYNYE